MLLLILLSPALATTWVVDPSGLGDATTLVDGFALLADGDTLEIGEGVYAEGGISVHELDVTVLGAGADRTVIDGATVLDYGIAFLGEGASISGVSFANFTHSYYEPALTAIFDNRDSDAADATQIVVEGCAFEDNEVALRASEASFTVRSSRFSDNHYAITQSEWSDFVDIHDNVFLGNGGGIYTLALNGIGPYGLAWTVANNTFVGGEKDIVLGMGSDRGMDGPELAIANNILTGTARALYISGYEGGEKDYTGTVANNVVGATSSVYINAPYVTESNTLTADPIFVAWSDDGDYTNDDLHLAPGSPGIDYGLDGYVSDDFDGVTRPLDGDLDGTAAPDCGAYELDPCDAGPNTVVESCNGIDDNCDGSIDEGVTTRFYADVDGDTYGDAANPVDVCVDAEGDPPTGYVTDATDCDDNASTTWPAAPETCGDGTDQDCDGSDLACPDTGDSGGEDDSDPGDTEDTDIDPGAGGCSCASAPTAGSSVLTGLVLAAASWRRRTFTRAVRASTNSHPGRRTTG